MKQQNQALAVTLGAAFFCITFFGWMAHDVLRLAWPEAVMLGSGLFLLTVLLAWPPSIKERMLKALPDDAKPIPASSDDFPLLNLAKVDSLTTELRALGFVLLCDYSEQSHSTPITPYFARVMLHDEQNCFVAISQFFVAGKALPIIVNFMSGLGVLPRHAAFEAAPPLPVPGSARNGSPQKGSSPEENFWLCGTHDRARSTILRIHRHPRIVGRRMGGATVEELFRRHLSDREKVSALLEQPLARDLSIEHYFAWNTWARNIVRTKLQHTNFYIALPRAYFDNREEWWGELGQIEPSS